MKITINIDCTPVEARQLAGLPDLQPMQERLMAEVEQKLRDATDGLSPDAMLRQWMGMLPTGAEQMKTAMEKFFKERAGA